MSFYGFEYFAGANVILKINGYSCLEAAAISYNYMDSKQPVYGYSSQTFDAVAPGQKLVQGSIVINYVYDNYLFDCIKKGWDQPIVSSAAPIADQLRQNEETLGATAEPPPTLDQLVNSQTSTVVDSQYLGEESNVTNSQEVNTQALNAEVKLYTDKIWSGNSTNEQIAVAAGLPNGELSSRTFVGQQTIYGDPLSIGGGVEIFINYGNRGEYLVIDSVHFVGRASAIQIDENVIVEEYSFFARNLRGSPTIL